jgi:hypothetical protein
MRPSTAMTQPRANRRVPVAVLPETDRFLADPVHANWLAGTRPVAGDRTAGRPR